MLYTVSNTNVLRGDFMGKFKIPIKYGDAGIEILSKILPKKEQWDNMYTIFSYILLIDNWKKK